MLHGFYAIFNWIVISSFMGSILIFLILIAKFAFSNASAKWHYYIWFLLLFRLIVPFTPESSFSMYNLLNHVQEGFSVSDNTPGFSAITNISMQTDRTDLVLSANEYTSDHNSGEQETINNHPGQLDYNKGLLLLWLLGVALFAGYTMFINVKVWYSVRNESVLSNPSISGILHACKSVMKISMHVPVVIVDKIQAPALFGLFRPRLLLPKSMINKLTEEQLRYICLHELAHWRRKDIFVNWITVILKILHWFNPIIWYGLYRMGQDCELACDSLVLSSIEPEKRKEYGHTVIQVLQMTLKPQWLPGATGMTTGKSHVKRRITMIANFKKQSLSLTIASVIIFTVIGVAGCTGSQNNNSLPAEVGSNESSYQQTLTEAETDQILAGTVDLKGPGVVVTLSESGVNNPQEPEYFIIHDTDIMLIVNQLKDAGAEAVSVNDERLVSTSSIGCWGTNITINHNACTGPFTIKAIGNTETLESSLNRDNSHAAVLRFFGVEVTIERNEKLLIPKYDGEAGFQYAELVK